MITLHSKGDCMRAIILALVLVGCDPHVGMPLDAGMHADASGWSWASWDVTRPQGDPPPRIQVPITSCTSGPGRSGVLFIFEANGAPEYDMTGMLHFDAATGEATYDPAAEITIEELTAGVGYGADLSSAEGGCTQLGSGAVSGSSASGHVRIACAKSGLQGFIEISLADCPAR